MDLNKLLSISDELIQMADDTVIEEFPTIVKEDASALLAATKIFLSNTQQLYIRIFAFNELQRVKHRLKQAMEKKVTIKENEIDLFRKYVDTFKALTITTQEFKIFESQIDKYQATLNQYLGKTIKTVFLYKDRKNNVTVYESTGDISEALKKDIASRGGGISARFTNSGVINSSVFQKMKSATKTGLQSDGTQEYVTPTYLNVLQRGKESRKILKNSMLILWQYGGVWKKMIVAGGAGDLGEAYLYFILSDERIKLFYGILEPDVNTFMVQGVANVDNISGLLKGDFSISDGIEYAAKANGASAMGYRQVIEMAETINTMSTDELVQYMKNEYQKILDQETSGSGRRNILAEGLNSSAEELLAEMIKTKYS